MGGEFQKIGAGGGGIEVGFVGESETVRVSVIKFLDWVGLGGVPVRMRRLGGAQPRWGWRPINTKNPGLAFQPTLG